MCSYFKPYMETAHYKLFLRMMRMMMMMMIIIIIIIVFGIISGYSKKEARR